MENSHNFTLNEAAKETGRSKGTISKALNNGKLSYIWCSNSMFLVVSFWVSKWTWILDLSCFSGNTLNNSEGSR
jgi:hypothetical protein